MPADNEGNGLLRELNWVHSAAVIVGTMLGAGIFVVTGQAAGVMGPAVPIGFILGIPIIVTTALVYSVYMSSPLGEHPGGAYVHISRTWNSLYGGYLFMWLKWVSFIGALAVLSIGFGEAMRFFDAFTFLSPNGWAIFWLTVFFALNLAGVDLFGNVQALLTAVLVGILIVLAVPGLLFVDTSNFSPLFPQQLYGDGFAGPLLQGTAALMFSYIGFEALAQTAGETENPRETLPKVFGYSTVFVGVLYTLVAIVVLGTMPWQEVANAERPLTAAAQTYFPVGTAGIVAFGSMLAYATSMNSTFMVPSRILYSFGEDRIVPEILTHVNERFHTPDIGLGITYGLAVVLILTSTFNFALLIALAALFLMYTAHSVSALALPHVNPELYNRCDLRFKPAVLSFIAIVSAISMGVFAWQTLSLSSIGPALSKVMSGNVVDGLTSSAALLIVVWAIVGSLIFFGYRAYLRSEGIEIDDWQELHELYEDTEDGTTPPTVRPDD
ncbi:APC family permease [Haladaptatus sp. NG-SE-30]